MIPLPTFVLTAPDVRLQASATYHASREPVQLMPGVYDVTPVPTLRSSPVNVPAGLLFVQAVIPPVPVPLEMLLLPDREKNPKYSFALSRVSVSSAGLTLSPPVIPSFCSGAAFGTPDQAVRMMFRNVAEALNVAVGVYVPPADANAYQQRTRSLPDPFPSTRVSEYVFVQSATESSVTEPVQLTLAISRSPALTASPEEQAIVVAPPEPVPVVGVFPRVTAIYGWYSSGPASQVPSSRGSPSMSKPPVHSWQIVFSPASIDGLEPVRW